MFAVVVFSSGKYVTHVVIVKDAVIGSLPHKVVTPQERYMVFQSDWSMTLAIFREQQKAVIH